MSTLDEFAERFERPQSAWTKEQWKQTAIELASRLDGTDLAPAKKGRQRHNGNAFVTDKNGKVTASAKANYEVLAWQVKQRMEKADADGHSLKIKEAVRAELVEAIRRHNNAPEELNRLRAGIGLPPLDPSVIRGERDGDIRESRANEMLETTYTEVRKLLNKWSENADR